MIGLINTIYDLCLQSVRCYLQLQLICNRWPTQKHLSNSINEEPEEPNPYHQTTRTEYEPRILRSFPSLIAMRCIRPLLETTIAERWPNVAGIYTVSQELRSRRHPYQLRVMIKFIRQMTAVEYKIYTKEKE